MHRSDGSNIFILLAVLFVGISAFYLLYIPFGLYLEARRSNYYGVFATIGERAIQQDRLGEIGYPAYFQAKIMLPREFILAPNTITCDSKIVASAVDPRLFRPSIALVDPRVYSPMGVLFASWRPLRVAIIYNGRPPDFTEFFNKDFAPSGLGPQQQFSQETLKLAGRAWESYAKAYKEIVLNRRFTWRSVECTDFTYTIFEEN